MQILIVFNEEPDIIILKFGYTAKGNLSCMVISGSQPVELTHDGYHQCVIDSSKC